ncbi:hypothetical protein BC830DRAFT_1167874 [Chytriomyces sp. MP71]|nr:hypothetical protein BC830DRAFT_1167874 [Chytriomyces sp. MP71]
MACILIVNVLFVVFDADPFTPEAGRLQDQKRIITPPDSTKHNQTDIIHWTMIATRRHPVLKQVINSLTAKVLARNSFRDFKTRDILTIA